MLGGKRNEGFKNKKQGGRPKVLNKTAIIVLSPEEVHEKQNLETPEVPEMAKKKKTLHSARQATFSSSQICIEVQKP